MKRIEFTKKIISHQNVVKTYMGGCFETEPYSIELGLKGDIYKFNFTIKCDKNYKLKDVESTPFKIECYLNIIKDGTSCYFAITNLMALLDNSSIFTDYELNDCNISIYIDTKNYKYSFCYGNIPEIMIWNEISFYGIDPKNFKALNMDKDKIEKYVLYVAKYGDQKNSIDIEKYKPLITFKISVPFEGEIELH